MTDEETIAPRVPRDMRTPITYAAEILSVLADIWADWFPEEAENAFFEEVLGNTWNDESTSGEDAENQLLEWAKSTADREFCPTICALFASCAYCVQAMKAQEAQERELAWTFAVDANYWATFCC